MGEVGQRGETDGLGYPRQENRLASAVNTSATPSGVGIPWPATATSPDICAPYRYWHSNDPVALAEVLETEIEARRTAAYGAFEISQRKPVPGVIFGGEPRDPQDFVENVADFVAFLRECGGFSIW
jgi:hypothetical protein